MLETDLCRDCLTHGYDSPLSRENRCARHLQLYDKWRNKHDKEVASALGLLRLAERRLTTTPEQLERHLAERAALRDRIDRQDPYVPGKPVAPGNSLSVPPAVRAEMEDVLTRLLVTKQPLDASARDDKYALARQERTDLLEALEDLTAVLQRMLHPAEAAGGSKRRPAARTGKKHLGRT